jgi:hypothetical protein
VDQRPLPTAKQKMLNARERQEFVNSVFGFHNFSINSTPAKPSTLPGLGDLTL